MQRLSTNDKLRAMLNAKDYDEDDQEIQEAVKEEQERARNRLRRTSLYGGGARAKIPKIKQIKKKLESPFKVLDPQLLPSKNDQLSSAVPPGAHNDRYQLVQFPTTKNRNDADRVFYTTSSMTDGIIHTPYQPPWYVGRNNKTEPPDGNLLMAASRYGFRGSKNIKQRLSSPYGPPSATKTEYTPKFLDISNDIINEWVPPIYAAKISTINNLESPKLWPQNAEYATGSKLKKPPTSATYKRETTIHLPERPKTSASLDFTQSQTIEIDNNLHDYARMESAKTFNSLPITTQSMFANSWNDRVIKTANPTLRATMKRDIPPYEAHTLTDPTDVMRYSGSTALIVHTQSTDELKFRLRMNKSKSLVPYELRWRQVTSIFRVIKSKLKRDQSITGALKDLAGRLRAEATNLGTPSSISRVDFLNILSKMSYFETAGEKQLSLLFSVFDPIKKNSIHFADLIVSFAVLDHPLDSAIEKLSTSFKLLREYGLDVPLIETALSSFLGACSSEKERLSIEKLFKEEFRPSCYRAAIFEEKRFLEESRLEREKIERESRQSNRKNSDSTYAISVMQDTNNNNNSNSNDNNNNSNTLTSPTKTAFVSFGGRRSTFTPNKGAKEINQAIEAAAAAALAKEEQDKLNFSVAIPSTPKRRQSMLTGYVGETEEGAGGQLIQMQTVGSKDGNVIASIPPVYNICNAYLDQQSFVSVLRNCPNLVSLYDSILRDRLIYCYGKDARYEVEDDGPINTDNADFRWILGKLS